MTPEFPPLAFIGGGNMARCLIGGLVARACPPARIHVAEPSAPLREALARDFGVAAYPDNPVAAGAAATWVLAVKPQVLPLVCAELAPLAQQQRPLVISIAAGVGSAQLDRWLGGGQAVVRAMPNTPALLGVGAIGLYANGRAGSAQRAEAAALMQATGLTEWVADEALMDAVTALSGSGPAYAFLLAEAMQAAGVAEGLAEASARRLCVQTLLGAARMLAEGGETPAELQRRVTSHGGTTEAALAALAAGGFRDLVATAIAAAVRRGRELSASHG